MNGFLRFLRTAKNQHIICKFQLIVSLLCFDLDLNVFIRIFKQKIVLAFNKDYFCLKCFFNSEKLQNLDIAVKLRHFTVDLCSCCYTNICCNRPFFSASHAANVAFCFSMTSSFEPYFLTEQLLHHAFFTFFPCRYSFFLFLNHCYALAQYVKKRK